MNALDPLFAPRSIALIGASHSEMKLGGVVMKNLLGFNGMLYPVNPKYDELMGVKAFAEVSDIPQPVDLALILRPAQEVPGILKEFRGKAKCVIVMSSGFAEVGETGLQDEVRRIGEEAGFRIVGPNCMGLYNPHRKLDTFFLPPSRLHRPKRGNVAVISQSGAILSCLLGAMKEARAGVSKAIGYGNAVDVAESDLFEYLVGDDKTEVVVSYVESVRDGRRFVQSARELSERKPLLVLKSGKGASGQAAAFSHTGRLAGRYEVFHSIAAQWGIREVADFDELLDAAKALAYQRPSAGGRVCIITNGGGSGVLAADECMRQGLQVPSIAEEIRDRLHHLFPDFFVVNNPVDLTAQVKDKDYVAALGELRDEYDGFVIIALPNVFGITENLGALLASAKAGLGRPIVAHIAESGITGKIRNLLERAGIPVYASPERAVRGLKALLSHGRVAK
ncbi:MAG: CoA-binding protein [Nitrospiraceae bacterium]|nr:CoA-binding protein [Nitrospiraceae bacterium]